MDIIRTYLTNVNNTTKVATVGNYKIVTSNDKNSKKVFLIYDPDNLVLNSKSLIKLLMIKTLPHEMLNRLINNTSQSIKKYTEKVSLVSGVLYEDRIFFNFDPYCNFLLGNGTKGKDIRDIITKTTTYHQKQISGSGTSSGSSSGSGTGSIVSTNSTKSIPQKEIDFSRIVNPYGYEKVVFTGGGTKGIIYVGAFLGLLATGQIFYLNHFAGTSVGALTSMIAGCITPPGEDYDLLRGLTLREIATRGCPIVERYQEALSFAMERFCKRNIETFYAPPSYTFYGIWTAIDTVIKNNGLYDPQKSGFQIWYALICKKICQIMKNGLDKLIIIKKKDGTFVEFPDVEFPRNLMKEMHESASNSSNTGTEGSPSKSPSSSPGTTTQTLKDDNKPETKGEIKVEAKTETKPDTKPDTSEKSDKQKDPLKVQEDEYQRVKQEFEKLYREYCGGIDIDTDQFVGWELVKFFTYNEYHELTKKTIVMTGTQTKRLGTVYYTHTDREYKDLSVMTGAMASMSIPLVFRAPIINDSYNLDGGIFDNYPLTHCDKKVKDKITQYNNKIFGYLIDDKNTVIDAYEIIRELWLVYDGFIEFANIGYLKDAPNYSEITEMFFEIRSEVYKLLYFTDVELETFLNRDKEREKVSGFNIVDLEEIFAKMKERSDTKNQKDQKDATASFNPDLDFSQLKLPIEGIAFVEKNLRTLDSHYRDFESIFKIGRKTDLADVTELSIRHGEAYNAIVDIVLNDIMVLESMDQSDELVSRYLSILSHLMGHILGYYELKGNFIKSDDLETPGKHFSEIMKALYKKMTTFETTTDLAVTTVNKQREKAKQQPIKNYIKNSIQIATTMIVKILTRGSGSNIDTSDLELNKEQSSYTKAVNYLFHTDMLGILYKYICIANDRICNDSFNRMRTIKLNTFETATLHFDMDEELKGRLIYEGFSKTIKHFTSLLHIMEITERQRPSDEYLDSVEQRYKYII
ncbi:hypothetical protein YASMINEVIRUS_1453 [Yasminevirus sp. GU-2018]|uniref:PNPLA domain-containing protein n=1 Tax=Yasminevirus sp. GU-2018 TaxID=2420051 RepID=A0A5K0UB55_9VIRU|nr:hypothetical protein YASMINEVIRUS_1453 [Yasminevirus sp. GU-2018]